MLQDIIIYLVARNESIVKIIIWLYNFLSLIWEDFVSWCNSFCIKHVNVIFLIIGQKPSESLLLNSLMVIPIHNFGMSISKYYDNQETKIVCSSANIPAFVNCSKASEYLGLTSSDTTG